MKADKKDIFKKVLKLADADKPSAGFTENLMQFIETDVKTEAALKTLLQQEIAVGPDFSFTANTMAQITVVKQATVYKPIITRKAWYAIAATMFVFFMLIGLSNQPTSINTNKNWIADAINYTHAIPPIYLMALVAVALLLLVDYLITRLKDRPQTA
jgi:hypothetical protein